MDSGDIVIGPSQHTACDVPYSSACSRRATSLVNVRLLIQRAWGTAKHLFLPFTLRFYSHNHFIRNRPSHQNDDIIILSTTADSPHFHGLYIRYHTIAMPPSSIRNYNVDSRTPSDFRSAKRRPQPTKCRPLLPAGE